MKYRVVVGGESCDCQLFVGFEGKPEGDATPADLIAALKANPEACAEVLAGMGPTHFAARDAEWWHDRFVAEKARAEQAEHSLAALRYQAQAGGCELSTVGENFYRCRTDALCGLCRLRHRAEQAERDRDMWRAKWEALETTRASCCAQMERERDEARATGRDNLAMWEVERDALRAKLAEAERMIEAARPFVHEAARNYGPPEAKAWLRALDSPVGAGTDSGGSGAAPVSASADVATPEPAGDLDDNAPAGDVMTARDHRYYAAGARHSLTRAELDELRWRVERLENLTGSGSGFGYG